MGDIICDDGDRRRNISRDNGDKRGNISVGDGRCGSGSKYTSHYSYRNMLEIVGGDWRGVYMYHTSHSFSHNPVDNGKLLRISFYYILINDRMIVAVMMEDLEVGLKRSSNVPFTMT